jgi:hypothetical protein
MADEKKGATKEYVVVFDQLGYHTGEFVNQGPGMQQLAVTKTPSAATSSTSTRPTRSGTSRPAP